MRRLLRRLLSPFADKARGPYRIMHHPGRGYLAVVVDEIGHWWIDKHGQEQTSPENAFAPLWKDDAFCVDEATAGARVNLHAQINNMKTVWRG